MPAGSVLRGDFVFAIMLVMRCGRRILLDRVNATKPIFILWLSVRRKMPANLAFVQGLAIERHIF
jgi:hypothetical protein